MIPSDQQSGWREDVWLPGIGVRSSMLEPFDNSRIHELKDHTVRSEDRLDGRPRSNETAHSKEQSSPL